MHAGQSNASEVGGVHAMLHRHLRTFPRHRVPVAAQSELAELRGRVEGLSISDGQLLNAVVGSTTSVRKEYAEALRELQKPIAELRSEIGGKIEALDTRVQRLDNRVQALDTRVQIIFTLGGLLLSLLGVLGTFWQHVSSARMATFVRGSLVPGLLVVGARCIIGAVGVYVWSQWRALGDTGVNKV